MKDLSKEVTKLMSIIQEMNPELTEFEKVVRMNVEYNLILQDIFQQGFDEGLRKALNITTDLEFIIDNN